MRSRINCCSVLVVPFIGYLLSGLALRYVLAGMRGAGRFPGPGGRRGLLGGVGAVALAGVVAASEPQLGAGEDFFDRVGGLAAGVAVRVEGLAGAGGARRLAGAGRRVRHDVTRPNSA